MNKYEGINKPEVNLSRNEFNGANCGKNSENRYWQGERYERENYGYINSFDGQNDYYRANEQNASGDYSNGDFQSDNRSAYRGDKLDSGSAFNEKNSKRGDNGCGGEQPKRQKGGFFKSFLLRAVGCALLLAFVFLPRFIPYKGSDKVTETVKAIVMTDITGNNEVGEGKLVEIIKSLIQKFSGSNS